LKTRWPTGAALETRYLCCPRCGLNMTLKSRWPALRHCPRCEAHDRTTVEFRSLPAPLGRLHAMSAPQTPPTASQWVH